MSNLSKLQSPSVKRSTAPLMACIVLLLNTNAATAAVSPEVVSPKRSENFSLPDALNEGLIESPRTSAIRFQLGITKSQLIRATELKNPTIFMDNGYKAEFTYRYGVTIPIELPWKVVLRVALAKNQIKQTDFEIIRALWLFRASVRKAYTDLVVAQELYRTLTQLADLTDQLEAWQRFARKWAILLLKSEQIT